MSVVDEIKERLDLTEIIGRYVQLQRSGRYMKGLCPFHSEKTPSFFVFPEDQRWRCFGCGKGGDLFTFVMEHEGWDFHTALEELGRQANVEVRPLTPTQVEEAAEEERLRAAIEAAADYYHTLLLSAPQAAEARAYVKRRGFKLETLKQFKVGYSLRSWDALRTHLLGQGFSVEELIKAGLLVEKDEGGTYDRFRDRLMIPIHDRRGRAIAFGGRVLNPEDQPKYMNSPQTPLFDKSHVLFGLDLASQAIRQADAAIIVEGYMDVMIPHQEGYANVVAPMGTALTEAHLKQLQRLTRHFILALDPDEAGITATLRGLETARQTLDRNLEAIFTPQGLIGYEGRLNVDIRVLLLPDGLDPDELILKDRAQWAHLVQEAQPIVRFYFEQLLQQEDANEPKGKARIVDAMLPLLQDISSSVEREAYAQEIALRLSLNAKMLMDRLRVRDRVEAVRQQAAVASTAQKRQPEDKEEHILNILFHFPDLLDQINTELIRLELAPLQNEDFTAENLLIWEAWMQLLATPQQELAELLTPETHQQVRQWLQSPLPETSSEQWQRDVVRTVLHLRERRIRETLNEVQSMIITAQAEGDLKGSEYAATFRELSEMLRGIQKALTKKL
ncbi:MAG: DNA primase [Anaerolineae bacterium]|jgi:DNA primase|nr:DNA primase [Anaerolineae bacterium]